HVTGVQTCALPICRREPTKNSLRHLGAGVRNADEKRQMAALEGVDVGHTANPTRYTSHLHGQYKPVLARTRDRLFISRVRMTRDTNRRIVPEHALDAARGCLGAVANDDDTGMLRVAHPHASSMMERHPRRTACGVQE